MSPMSKKFTVSRAIHEIETRYQSPKKHTNHKQDIHTNTNNTKDTLYETEQRQPTNKNETAKPEYYNGTDKRRLQRDNISERRAPRNEDVKTPENSTLKKKATKK
ncbi:hypothetical protein C2G38_2229275 [Gigaspora rosea]|uniref:Uncharacterized protein n=1 Tax=Gigaspora rosea TaxID=44941 RepID=A0A397U4E2_9GLOM|nr:hypothetical protein C2G38_2229275 [Gigaspora rosea]